MKRTQQFIATFILTLAIILQSCSSDTFLEVKPKGQFVPSTIADYRLFLDQTDPGLNFTAGAISDGFEEKHEITAFVTDDFFIDASIVGLGSNQTQINESKIRAYLFEDIIYPSQQDPAWNRYYSQIYLANVVIEGLKTVTDGTPEQINALAAEAKLHRAYAYFNLVNIYSQQYDPSAANTDLGVPVREGIALEDVNLTRASVESIYDYILTDIQTSLEDLEDLTERDVSFRPSKTAALGLLARTYLFKGEYELAKNAVDEALAIYNELRDLNNDRNSVNNGAILRLPLILNDPEVIWYKEFNGNYFVSSAFIQKYGDGDLRRRWFIESNVLFGQGVNGFYLAASIDNGNIAYDGINTPELFLMSAECNARLNNITLANTALNQLREKRFEPDAFEPIDIQEPTALLNFIKEERRRELVNGTSRFFDIKRYNRLDNDNITVTHELDNQTYTLAPNDAKWALSISPVYIQLNPEIEQNPRN